jgi:hypothetical protein
MVADTARHAVRHGAWDAGYGARRVVERYADARCGGKHRDRPTASHERGVAESAAANGDGRAALGTDASRGEAYATPLEEVLVAPSAERAA